MTTFPRSLLVLALLLTGLNAVKPLVIDDAAYYYYAKQIASHPLDPYGFDIFWYDAPQPANTVLAPPVFLYWFAAAVRLFGESPVLWKLWLFPVALLLTAALHDLFRRFAAGLEVPLTWMTVLSPAVLPGFNLMLDVPALAVSLSAIALFLRAVDRDSLTLATAAGLVAGLGMQTKYTGVTAPAVMLAAAVVWGRPRLWLPAAVTAMSVFVAWELVTALLYGESHFLAAFRTSAPDADLTRRLHQKARLILPLLGNFGCVAPGVVILSLVATGASSRGLALAAGLLVLPFALMALIGISLGGINSNHALCVVLGLGAVATGLMAGASVCRHRPPDRTFWFLLIWLAVEILAAFALTPFPAVRRVLGVLVVATLVAGRLAAPGPLARVRSRWAVGVAAAFGLLVFSVDLLEAWTVRAAVAAAAARARELGGGEVWYVGHWGFQFYAESAGIRPLVPGVSELKAGDLVIVPDPARVYQPSVDWDNPRFEAVDVLKSTDWVPWRTVWNFYSGYGTLEGHGPHFHIRNTDLAGLLAGEVAVWQHGSYDRLEVGIYRNEMDGRVSLRD